MRRNLDIIRAVMLAAEESDIHKGPVFMNELSTPEDVTAEEWMHHAIMCIDAGYLIGRNFNSEGPDNVVIQKITHDGHEFLSAIRSDTVWKDLKQAISKVGGTVGLEIVKRKALSISATMIGL